MTQTRREFLGLTKSNEKFISNISPYANKKLPKFGARSALDLTKVTTNLTRAEATHIMRRLMIAPNKSDIDYATGKDISTVVDFMLNPLAGAMNPAPPVRYYTQELDKRTNLSAIPPVPSRDVAYGATWVGKPRLLPDPLTPNDFNDSINPIMAARRASFKNWWVGNLLNQDRSILEKMLIFWHNHFAIEDDVVQDPDFLWQHFSMLRANALGNFRDLVRLVTIDPLMLYYLNNRLNVKGAPDENYARELQELFTLGRGSGYTEDDVKAMANVLTGHSINYTTFTYEFKPNNHETGDKQFSAFYNSTKIIGKTSMGGGSELDDLYNMIFAKDDIVSRFIVRKIYRFFVYYTIDQFTEDNVIIPLANIFKSSWDIKPVLKKLFESAHFMDMISQSCNIKNPVDMVVSPFRMFNASFSAAPTDEQKYNIWNSIRNQMVVLQMEPGNPPNVAGWQAYYQEPQYYEIWINSDTYPKRMAMIDTFITGNFRNSGISLKPDFLAWVDANISDPADPNVLISELSALLLGLDISTAVKNAYKTSYLLTGQVTDSYWTNAWNAWKSAPTVPANITGAYDNRLKPLIIQLLKLEEFQLS
ncbi:MAG: DUF1800 domain-containing protein [Chitinophagales bacterium]|nr:DUF1800 domain-containing protein [Chitinophagales bacterium]